MRLRLPGLLIHQTRCADYGEQTRSKYCTYYEVKYAYEKDIPIIPLKLYKGGQWPPAPEEKGAYLSEPRLG
jgi:hypothetical protein